MSQFEVRFANNKSEREEVYTLRFEVFNKELNEGLQSSQTLQMDIDEWDDQCEHIIVIDKEINKIVGTYRIQTYEMAMAGRGFVTNQLFEISDFPEDILKNSMEIGRACIHKNYRRGRVLFLLWQKVLHILIEYKKEVLFGSGSFFGNNLNDIIQTYSYIKDKNYFHNKYFVKTKEKHAVKGLCYKPNSIPNEIPGLFKTYIRNGCKVCSGPAIDFEFNTFDFIIFLKLSEADPKRVKLFL